jgi:hypothetical protein
MERHGRERISAALMPSMLLIPKSRIHMMRCLLAERLRLGWLVRILPLFRKTTKARENVLLQRNGVTRKYTSHVKGL